VNLRKKLNIENKKSAAISRPSWDEYFMQLAHLIATRATCTRRKVGAVVVKNKRILATGYNGTPSGVRHCSETGCLREKLGVPSGERQEICRGLHGEQNAIIQAATSGTSIKESVLYCTTQPCVTCAKMIINAGITRVTYEGVYPDKLALEMLKEAGIKLIRFKCK